MDAQAGGRIERKKWAHYLQPNHRVTMPRYVVVFDVETSAVKCPDGSETHYFRLGWAAYINLDRRIKKPTPTWYAIASVEGFWTWIESVSPRDGMLWMFAHNARFDLIALQGFSTLAARGWDLEFCYDEGRTQIFQWRRDGRTIKAVSTTNYFMATLRQIGDLIGLEKLPIDFENCDDIYLSEYCQRDTEILLGALLQYFEFVSANDLGAFRVTIGGQAMAAYRHRFMEFPVYIHKDKKAQDLEQRAYHGGRCECMKVGTFEGGEYYQLDVNSMYVWLLATRNYPTGLNRVVDNPLISQVQRSLRTQGAIADVDLIATEPKYPVFYRGRNVYPIGQMRAVLTTPELQEALDKDIVQRIHAIAYYKMRPAFNKYAFWAWERRAKYKAESNELYSRLIKDLGNSLYGKFGQTDTVQQVVGKCALEDVWREYIRDAQTGETYKMERIGGQVRKVSKGAPSDNSFIAIAAHVTAYGRMWMHRLINLAGRNNCFYCDTDSIIVNRAGYDALAPERDDLGMGRLKIEKAGKRLVIHARKDYELDDKIIHKGIPAGAKQIAEAMYELRIWPSITSQLRKPATGGYTIYPVVKRLSREIADGEVLDDGSIEPFVFVGDRQNTCSEIGGM